jgi:hypothetical protein
MSRLEHAADKDGAWLSRNEASPIQSLAQWSGQPMSVCAEKFRGGPRVLARFIEEQRGNRGRLSTRGKQLALQIRRLRWRLETARR